MKLLSSPDMLFFLRKIFYDFYGFYPAKIKYTIIHVWEDFSQYYVSVSVGSHIYLIEFRPRFLYRTFPGTRCAKSFPEGYTLIYFKHHEEVQF